MSGEHRLNADFDQDKELREMSKTFAALEQTASPQDQQKLQALVNDAKPLQDMGYIARSQMAYGDRSDLLKSMETSALELEAPQLKAPQLKAQVLKIILLSR